MDAFVFFQRGFLFMFWWNVLRLHSSWPSIDGAAALSIDGGSSDLFFGLKKLLYPFMKMISAMSSLDMWKCVHPWLVLGLLDPWKYQNHLELDNYNLYYLYHVTWNLVCDERRSMVGCCYRSMLKSHVQTMCGEALYHPWQDHGTWYTKIESLSTVKLTV